MTQDIDDYCLGADATLRAAMAQMNSNGQGILLVIDGEGRLVRTVTDGDLRRALVQDRELEDTLAVFPAKPPLAITHEEPYGRALELMELHAIRHIPVTQAGRPTKLLKREDLEGTILLSTPHMSDAERRYVDEAFNTNWIAPLGPNVDAFEEEMAAYLDAGHAAAMCSGTAAIHLGLDLLGVGHGDSVFCSNLTFVASANPILYLGAKPTFIDAEPTSWNMSAQALERALSDAKGRGELPKAVVLAHLYGQPANLTDLIALCDAYGVPVLEDAAESLGARYAGRHTGTFGTFGAFSFNGNKIITTSGGGMLVSADEELIAKARYLSTQAKEPAGYYLHTRVGYNYRMSNVLAGIGRGQLNVLESRVAARRRVYDAYSSALADIPGVREMPEHADRQCSHWLSVFLVDPDTSGHPAAELVKALNGRGIEARRVWNPMHRQPLFEDAPYIPHAVDESVSDRLFDTGICLPSGSNMSDGQLDRVISELRSLVA